MTSGKAQYRSDSFPTSAGELTITFLGHGSLLIQFKGMNIYLDPFSRVADYAQLPKADVILITHEHRDHLDPAALEAILTNETSVILTEIAASQLGRGMVMHNGEERTVRGIRVEAVPAYNLVNRRPGGDPFHPKGAGNGYVLTLGERRVYLAGDTEAIPEMKQLKEIDIAFLPMNLPYTMTPEMCAEAARSFRPAILYPYHFGETDPSLLAPLLKDAPEIEVRIRPLA